MAFAGEVARALHKWRMEEMNYTCPDTSLTVSAENLTELCCGPFLDVWKYISDNVYNNETVHTARGNIELQSRDYETKTEIDDCLPSAEELENTLRMVESEIEGVRSDNAQLQLDLNSKYETDFELVEATRRCQRVSHCYRLMTSRCTEEASAVKLSVDLLATLLNCQSDPVVKREESDSSDSFSNMALFEQNIGFIGDKLRPTGESVMAAKDREVASDLVRQCMASCSHAELLQWMEKLQRQDMISLQQSVRQRDEVMDVEDERLADSAQRVIDSLRLTHVQWCFDIYALRSNCTNLTSSLEEHFLSKLHSLTQADEIEDKEELLRRYIQQQSKEYGTQLLKKLCQQLEQKNPENVISSAEKNNDEVRQWFEETLNSVDSVFTAATRHRQERTAELSTQLQKSGECLRSVLSAQTGNFTSVVQTVTSHVCKDARVLRLPGDGLVAASQLSTSLPPLVQWHRSALSQVLSAGEARCFRLVQRLRRQTDFSQHLQGVSLQINNALQKEVNHTLHRMKQNSEKQKKVADAINVVGHSLQIWKDEPAQAAANDVVYEGMFFPQWRERYRANRAADRTISSIQH